MVFLLSDRNVQTYLAERSFCGLEEPIQVASQSCKNFNLVIFAEGKQWLIKQESHQLNGQTNGDLAHEWRAYQLFQAHLELRALRDRISEAVYFDCDHAILVFDYLDDYCDLDKLYTQRSFPPTIAAALGAAIASVHRATLDRADYRTYLQGDEAAPDWVPDFAHGLAHPTPDIFAESPDALKFYELYQRYESLGEAIAQLSDAYDPCCLTHNDLKFDNVLVRLPLSRRPQLRLIDWEKWAWGDPTADLGTLIASYLKIWLKSVPISAAIELETALRLAETPLERLQPSLRALLRAYVQHFPEIKVRIPDFLPQAMRFAGLALIERIRARLHYYEPFGNAEIAMMQVAKSLLCAPEQSIAILGAAEPTELAEPIEPTPAAWGAAEPPPPPAATAPPRCTQHELTQAERLEDLIHQLQITPDCDIQHPVYALAAPADAPVRLHRCSELPTALQHRYLQEHLRNVLYDLYYSGELALEPIEGTPIENSTVRGIHAQFYQQLQHSNSGTGYFDPGWHVLRQTRRGYAMYKEGLTVYVQPALHLPIANRSPAVGSEVAIRLPPSRIESGFYVAVGNMGAPPQRAIELCFNVLPAGAVALMEHLTQPLNALSLPFLFKVLADPAAYDRYDTGVLQVDRRHYAQVRELLQPLYAELRSQFRPAVPLFTKAIAPGVGVAEEPHETAEFGGQRCQLVAEALLSVWQTADDSPEGRRRAIQQRFAAAGVDWNRPYLNPNSADFFTPLD